MVVSFGLFSGTVEELRDAQAGLDRSAQLAAIDPAVEEVLLDGAFEVVEELTP